jgi:hypothetical protein
MTAIGVQLHNVATKAFVIHPGSMSLKNAATIAFIGTLLATALLVWDLVFDVVNVTEGLIPLVRIFPALLYAIAALSLTVFFYVFQKTRN